MLAGWEESMVLRGKTQIRKFIEKLSIFTKNDTKYCVYENFVVSLQRI
jgi:hypothetical protein